MLGPAAQRPKLEMYLKMIWTYIINIIGNEHIRKGVFVQADYRLLYAGPHFNWTIILIRYTSKKKTNSNLRL